MCVTLARRSREDCIRVDRVDFIDGSTWISKERVYAKRSKRLEINLEGKFGMTLTPWFADHNE